MKEETLNAIRTEYEKEKSNQEALKRIKKQITELEENPFVTQYLKLKEDYKNIYNDVCAEQSDEEIIKSIFRRYMVSEKETNSIYFCLGSFMYSMQCDIDRGYNDMQVSKDNPFAEFKSYMDIENEYNVIEVPIKECEEFEKTHKVIVVDKALVGEWKYYEVQSDFIKTAVEEGQEKACQRVMTKKY